MDGEHGERGIDWLRGSGLKETQVEDAETGMGSATFGSRMWGVIPVWCCEGRSSATFGSRICGALMGGVERIGTGAEGGLGGGAEGKDVCSLFANWSSESSWLVHSGRKIAERVVTWTW